MKKVKFTKASQKDKHIVTLNLKQLEETFNISTDSLFVGDVLEVTIGSKKLQFKVNRQNFERALTASTNKFPFRHPQVGKPFTFTVKNVEEVSREEV